MSGRPERHLTHVRCCELSAAETMRFAALLDDVEPTLAVPTCPAWTAGELARHLGGVHRWAAHQVGVLAPERVAPSEIDLGLAAGEPPSGDWIRAGVAPMEAAFSACDPDAAMWAWGADQHARFWPRRMVHETAVHSADLALATGAPFELAAEIAVDGIDELLDNVSHAAYFAPRVTELRGDGETLHLHATDAEGEWTILLGPDGYRWEYGHGKSTVAARGAATDLLLLLYGRLPTEGGPVEIFGERSLLEFWLERSAL